VTVLESCENNTLWHHHRVQGARSRRLVCSIVMETICKYRVRIYSSWTRLSTTPEWRGGGKEPSFDIRGWELTRSPSSVLSLPNRLPNNSLSLDSRHYAGRLVACSPRGLCATSSRSFAGHGVSADAYPTRKIVISIHVGQAGVQIGNACCKPFTTRILHSAYFSTPGELYTVEHGLSVR
jgi:hypothetical protein